MNETERISKMSPPYQFSKALKNRFRILKSLYVCMLKYNYKIIEVTKCYNDGRIILCLDHDNSEYIFYLEPPFKI